MNPPTTERKFLKKSLRSDYVKTELDITLEKVGSSVEGIKEVTTELIQKVDDKLVEVDECVEILQEKVDFAILEIQSIEIPQGEKGDKGDDGVSPSIEDILSRIPTPEKLDEEQIISKILKAIPENKPSLKVIQESIDQDKLIEELTPKLKLKVENIDGLDKTLKLLDKRYIHGGGDTVSAGTNVTITTVNGTKRINATGITSYAETPSGVIDGVNKIFTTANTITFINGLYLSGMYIHPISYSFAGTTITFVEAPDISFADTPFTVVYY